MYIQDRIIFDCPRGISREVFQAIILQVCDFFEKLNGCYECYFPETIMVCIETFNNKDFDNLICLFLIENEMVIFIGTGYVNSINFNQANTKLYLSNTLSYFLYDQDLIQTCFSRFIKHNQIDLDPKEYRLCFSAWFILHYSNFRPRSNPNIYLDVVKAKDFFALLEGCLGSTLDVM
jgi:hypothetical protein